VTVALPGQPTLLCCQDSTSMRTRSVTRSSWPIAVILSNAISESLGQTYAFVIWRVGPIWYFGVKSPEAKPVGHFLRGGAHPNSPAITAPVVSQQSSCPPSVAVPLRRQLKPGPAAAAELSIDALQSVLHHHKTVTSDPCQRQQVSSSRNAIYHYSRVSSWPVKQTNHSQFISY